MNSLPVTADMVYVHFVRFRCL